MALFVLFFVLALTANSDAQIVNPLGQSLLNQLVNANNPLFTFGSLQQQNNVPQILSNQPLLTLNGGSQLGSSQQQNSVPQIQSNQPLLTSNVGSLLGNFQSQNIPQIQSFFNSVFSFLSISATTASTNNIITTGIIPTTITSTTTTTTGTPSTSTATTSTSTSTTTTSTTTTTTSTSTTSTTTSTSTTTTTTSTSTTTTTTSTSTTTTTTSTSTTTTTTSTSTTTTTTSTSTTTTTTSTSTTTTTTTTTTSTSTTTTTTIIKSYLSSCTSNEICDSTKNLYCSANSQYNSSINVCDCASTFYWNSTVCVQRKSYGEACTVGNDRECGYGLNCIASICNCQSNEYWNSTNNYCAPKLLLYFTSNYTTQTINNYNGTSFGNVVDIKVIEQPTYYIYVSDQSNVIQYSQSGGYIRYVAAAGAFGLQPINNDSIYVSNIASSALYKLSSSLDLLNATVPANSTYVQASRYMRYNPSNGYLYECNRVTSYVNVYDLEYNRIANESFRLNEPPIGIGFYQSVELGNLILITTLSNNIKILKQSDGTTYKTLSICNGPRDILVHQKSGYFLVSCANDNRVQLWHTNGTEFENTGEYLNIYKPFGICYDSNARLYITNYDGHYFSILTLV